jgi:hypothetical protein
MPVKIQIDVHTRAVYMKEKEMSISGFYDVTSL